MSTDTYGCADTHMKRDAAPAGPALLEYAAAESAQIGDTAAASLYAALQVASDKATEDGAVQTDIFLIDPPVAFTTGHGSIHQIDAVKVNRFRGNIEGRSDLTFEEVTSPHIELRVKQINPDGTPARLTPSGSWWADLDGQIDANEIAALFPAADFGETCEQGCIEGDINIDGTFEGIVGTITPPTVVVHVNDSGRLTREDVRGAVEDALASRNVAF